MLAAAKTLDTITSQSKMFQEDNLAVTSKESVDAEKKVLERLDHTRRWAYTGDDLSDVELETSEETNTRRETLAALRDAEPKCVAVASLLRCHADLI